MLPSLFPPLFCGWSLSIYLNGDSQVPTVWVSQDQCLTTLTLKSCPRMETLQVQGPVGVFFMYRIIFPKLLHVIKLAVNIFMSVWPPSCHLYDLAVLCSVNTMLPVTLENPTMFLYITITFFHTPLRPGPVKEENEIRLGQPWCLSHPRQFLYIVARLNALSQTTDIYYLCLMVTGSVAEPHLRPTYIILMYRLHPESVT